MGQPAARASAGYEELEVTPPDTRRGQARSTALDATKDQDPLCLNCGARIVGQYCHDCGQEESAPLVPLGEWARELLDSFFALDFRWLRTLRTVLFQPGQATVDYAAGKRVGQISPLRLYVLTSAVAIAAMSLAGFFSAESFAAADLDLSPDFEKRYRLIFPVINLLSPFLLAFVVAALYRRRYFQLHLIFALHFWSFLVAAGTPFVLVPRIQSSQLIPIIGGTWTVVAGLYLWFALSRVYPGSRWYRILSFMVVGVGLIGTTAILSIAALMLAGLGG
jgi:hypothetical protein